MSRNNLTEQLQQKLNSEFAALYGDSMLAPPEVMAKGSGKIADAWFITAHIADALLEPDAAYLLRQDKPLSALMDQWRQSSRVQAKQHELTKCVSAISAAELEAGEPMTVKELLLKNPDAGFSIFSSGGYIDLSPDEAKELLAGSSVNTSPGDNEFAMKIDADGILGQVVLGGQLENGVWNIMADWPEPEMEQGMQMGGLS